MSNVCIGLFQDAPVLLAEVDEALVCRDINRTWLDLLGLEQATGPPMPVAGLCSPQSVGPVLERIDQVVHDGAVVRGLPVSLMAKARPVAGLLSAWRVIPEYRPTRALIMVMLGALPDPGRDALSRLRSAHRLILDAAGEGIYGLDGEGRATFVNRAATEILGWRPDEILGQPLHDVHHHTRADGSLYPREACPIYAAIRDGEVRRVDDEVFWRRDGGAVPVEYTSTPILHDGRSEGAVVVFRDISERKRLEQQRQAATLRGHDWPGNIRELKNVIERAVILSKGDRLRLDLAMPGARRAGSIADVATTAGGSSLPTPSFERWRRPT